MSNYAHFTSVPAASEHAARRTSVRSLPTWAAPAALGAVMVLAAILYGWALSSLGWGNSYYSAAVKSMGKSWTNFLFGSFDPVGVVTVDKPPAALWPQVISSKIFGLHGWALMLPQVLEGVAAVLVLHRTVRRWAGEGAALVAALVLTLTPITVAINRDNNPDTLLVLLLVSAAYALTRALQAEGRAATWWLCASGFLIGCGFLTKMLAAWMVIPAFAVAWLVGGSGAWIPRVRRLLGAGAILAASSLWWVAMVALWPGDRPYIGGSDDGSAWDLVIGYNGLGRVFGSSDGMPQGMGGGGGGGGGFAGGFGGQSGLTRMFDSQVGGQISWLLPLCGLALAGAVVVAVLHRRGKLPASALLPASGWLLWGTWLVVCAAVFSTQKGIFHPYYTTQLAPAIAALCGGLTAGLVRVHRAGFRWAPLAGAAGVVVSVVWAVVLVRRVPDWNGWLVWPVLLVGCAAVVLLVLARRNARLLTVAVGAAVASVLVAPGAWAVSVPGSTGMGGSNPTAGPTTMGFGGGGGMPRQGGNGGGLPSGMPSGMPSNMPGLPGADGSSGGSGAPSSGGMPSGMPSGMPTAGAGGMPGAGSGGAPGGRGGPGGGGELTADQRKILQYAVKHAPDARIKLAVEGGALSASAFILGTDETVIGMGGFTNSDNAPSVAQLKKWTKNGELRYILGSGTNGGGPGGMSGGYTKQRSDWIADNCTKVPASSYGGTSSEEDSGGVMGFGEAGVLYDCAAK
ncbi:4-amino-4-deoxy-L-arabinose transferase-like glycosyltransferase [Streptomyces phaeochromogenes]|uniref:ArnT family glycosyltransferase n=1 Tax=Streptomyces phaeochromogenes TaxID=1923 RepID=UPI00278E3DC1|nr:glycosyltransferase family 39 protein [Streptomyces phaeochromogenes]MDQ0946821.1 4-amino-4-deoxy-L-arabinose transferase-like glycosyltransferase [Streptomyces phaeochromogenes]